MPLPYWNVVAALALNESENPPFRVLKVNENYRVIRASFDKWMGIDE